MEKYLKEYTCCFTGHRPEKLPWGTNETDSRCLRLKERIYDVAEALFEAGIRHFICGMARACDLYFGEAIVALRDEHENITLEAAIPCEEQTRDWSEEDKKRYYYLAHLCDTVTVLQKEYTQDCMLKRNRYMVEHSSVLIAAYDGSSGGTRYTINYASQMGLEILELTII